MASREEGSFNIALVGRGRGTLRDVLSDYAKVVSASGPVLGFEEKVANDPRVADLIRRVAEGEGQGQRAHALVWWSWWKAGWLQVQGWSKGGRSLEASLCRSRASLRMTPVWIQWSRARRSVVSRLRVWTRGLWVIVSR